MIIVDKHIRELCQGIIPSDIFQYYSRHEPLSDKDLAYFLDQYPAPLVTPYDPSLVNPASLDIRIGETAKLRNEEKFLVWLWRKLKNFWRWYRNQVGIISIFNPIEYIYPPEYEEVDLSQYSKTNPYLLMPGDKVLVGSLETINLPPFLTCQFKLKSSRAREWYGHQFAGFCDPGWNGSKLTMEIVNDDIAPLPLYPGLKIGQLIFSLTFGVPEKDYSITGRYNNDKKAEASKG